MAIRLIGVDPVFATWTVSVVVDPEVAMLTRLALRLPFAYISELSSSPESECLHPMVLSPCPSDCLRTPTEDGTRV